MSSLIVEVKLIDNVRSHPGADKLDIVEIGGWQLISAKGLRKAGDRVVYVPPDSVLPRDLSDKLDLTKYLSSNGRVKSIKLRGEPSFGVLLDADPSWPIGFDAASFYGITKHVWPVKSVNTDAAPNHPLWQRYTDIDNINSRSTVIPDGEMVVISEKNHGSSISCGSLDGEIFASSHNFMRKRPSDEDMPNNNYWFAYTLPGVKQFIDNMQMLHKQVIIYGEVYGRIQSLHYGIPGQLGFAAFDILIDGKYLNFDEFEYACKAYDIPMVHILYKGPFSLSKVKELSVGKTTYNDNHIREGCVIRLSREQNHPRYGRIIFKSINPDYLCNRDKKEEGDTTDV